MRFIRKSTLNYVPWKNGGGVTREVVRVPSCGAPNAPFRWRVSIADIGKSGPFSLFPAHHRVMVLLQGNGVHLTFDDGQRACLRSVGDAAEFDGALQTHCELLSGPCVDLNLIVAKSLSNFRAWVEIVHEARVLHPPADGTLLIFPITGGVQIASRFCDVIALENWDLALLSMEDGPTLTPPAMAPLVFFATMDDNFD